MSFAFGDEACVITFMDEDVTDQTAGAPHSPAAAAGGGAVIEAFRGELGADSAIARAVAHVEIGFDGASFPCHLR